MKKGNQFSLTHRWLHWLIATAMSVLYLTGFLRMTWMDKKHMAGIISAKAPQGAITSDQAVAMAKAIRDPMFEWHNIFAIILAVLFIIRLVYMMMKGVRFPSPFKEQETLSMKIQGWSYIIFYILVGFNVFSGFYHMWGPSGEFKGLVTGMHKWALYWFPGFIIIHFVGIVVGEIGKEKGVVSKMIGGD